MRTSPPFWWYNAIRKGVIVLQIGNNYFSRYAVVAGKVMPRVVEPETLISTVIMYLEGGNALFWNSTDSTQEEMRQALQILEEIDTVETADEISIGS